MVGLLERQPSCAFPPARPSARAIGSRLTFANVASGLCLVVLVGSGTANAAVNNLVNSADILDGTIRSADVRDSAIRTSDVRDNAIRTGDVSATAAFVLSTSSMVPSPAPRASRVRPVRSARPASEVPQDQMVRPAPRVMPARRA